MYGRVGGMPNIERFDKPVKLNLLVDKMKDNEKGLTEIVTDMKRLILVKAKVKVEMSKFYNICYKIILVIKKTKTM